MNILMMAAGTGGQARAAAVCRSMGFSTWLMMALLTLITGGFWLGLIAGWHIDDLVNPKYYCNRCDKIVRQAQFRI